MFERGLLFGILLSALFPALIVCHIFAWRCFLFFTLFIVVVFSSFCQVVAASTYVLYLGVFAGITAFIVFCFFLRYYIWDKMCDPNRPNAGRSENMKPEPENRDRTTKGGHAWQGNQSQVHPQPPQGQPMPQPPPYQGHQQPQGANPFAQASVNASQQGQPGAANPFAQASNQASHQPQQAANPFAQASYQ